MNLFDVYSLFPIQVVRGKGCRVWDESGQEYLDLYGGHAVICIGHCHPHYVEMMTAQLGRLGFYSNSVINNLQQQLAQRLGRACGYEDYRLFLVNSGAEANENAMKLASFHTGRRRVLSLEKAFHGRTSLAVEVTDNPKIVAPINAGGHVSFLPMDDLSAWEHELRKGDVACCILECIQGVGGIRMVSPEFYQGLRRLCSATGTVLVCDEIQCGYGRSGRFFAHQHLFDPDRQPDMAPDLITVAKGIGNGFPMSALLIAPQFQAVKGQLGTTFGGNHLACTAALAVLDVMEDEHLVENAAQVGSHLIAELRKLVGEKIVEVRGRGLMIGIELSEPYKELRNRLLFEEHCFTGCAGTHTLRLLPPLCLSTDEADMFIEKLKSVL
ncbi:MAG: aminotransferase class III-fold pyridoxal phosphate-dependent enzyme [Bacteroidaceae bacterium]|nr:aminotransferase class III-fold pyridoxal phosphate-dependent enzyme [Bacteroidaceae bacterium]